MKRINDKAFIKIKEDRDSLYTHLSTKVDYSLRGDLRAFIYVAIRISRDSPEQLAWRELRKSIEAVHGR